MELKDKYVFISYSSKNQQSADAVRMLLTDNAISSWMAPYDIPAGSKYAYEINDAIEGCACLVLLLTEESQASEFVEKEVERAITYKKTIIPIQLGNIILNSGFKYYLGNSQIIALTRIDENSEEWIKVKKAISSFVFNEKSGIPVLKADECKNHPYEIKSGKLEDTINWKLESNGDLHIEGTGELKGATVYGQSLEKVVVDLKLKNIQNKVYRIYIGKGIKKIGEFSFYGFQELKEVYISHTVELIGAGAFKNCYRLCHIELPLTLKAIGTCAFKNCFSLENFELPNEISISSEAFKNCHSLTRLEKRFGKSIILYQRVFENCRNLNYISLEGVEFIGAYAFEGCPIEYVELSFQRGCLEHTIHGHQTLQQAAFALSGVREIHLRFPNMFMSTAISYDIDEDCFYKCDKLTDVFFEEAVPYISTNAFPDNPNICMHVKKSIYNNKLINSILKSKYKVECIH